MNAVTTEPPQSRRTEVVVVGAGPAGLATSWHLRALGVDHVVLERGDVGETWRSARWDAFTLVTPNWSVRMPGRQPDTDATTNADATDSSDSSDSADGFRGRDQVVHLFASYARDAGLPVRTGVGVASLVRREDGFSLTTTEGTWLARAVVVASGAQRLPRLPAGFAPDPGIAALHAVDYRNPSRLAPGAVLVVGSGQSGSQIAEELNRAGRRVYLATSPVGRVPRRYRGRDAFAWLREIGLLGLARDDAAPEMRQATQPVISGARGGHTIALQQLARDGVTLLGRLTGAEGMRFTFADDLAHNMAAAERRAADFRRRVDAYLEAHPDPAVPGPDTDPAERAPEAVVAGPTRLDAREHGITTVLWCTGMRPDTGWLPEALLDDRGAPRHHRGITDSPGLYVVGFPWLSHFASGILYGIGTDAERIAARVKDDLGGLGT